MKNYTLFKYQEELNFDEECNSIDDFNEIQFILFQVKDTPSDDKGICSFGDLRKEVLLQPMEVICISKSDKKIEVALNPQDDEDMVVLLVTRFRN